ncbi:MAG: hypothetical protein J0M12_16495, partial [Deltaproteobacteria bacterium]|nr:hypothetical protein [Deltaproteobacteria bacterium]
MPSPQTEPNASVPAPETSAGYTLVSAQIQDVHEAIAKLDLGKKCFDRFWQSVIALDETYRRLSGTDFPGDETERAIAAKALGESSTEASITDLLSLAGRQHEALLNARDLNLLPPEEALRATIANLEKLGIFVVRDNDAIFVETAHAAGICRGDGEGVPPPQYQPRVEQLILELQSCGIYKEDLIVRVGSVRANMIRTLPYIIIEIPGIDREIAVCNQIGEVTFIARTIFGPNFYTSHTKSELKENPRISSVAYRDRSTWISEIKDLLFVPGDDIRRIDVRDIENLRTAIKAQQGMSVEHWVTMTKVEKLNYRVPQTEMGLKALATRMEVHGNPLGSQKFHLQLAQKIFGESEIINSALLKISQHEQDFQLSG